MEELDQMLMMGNHNNKKVRTQPLSYLHEIDISGVIGHPSEFLEELHLLRNASENDIVKIHINSEGGQVNTLVQLVNAIRICRATVITALESEAHSAASALFLQGDQFQVGEHAAMLVHEPSGGNWDYHSKSKSLQAFSVKHSENLFRDFYKDFLMDTEIDEILEGKDLWLSSEEIMDRLKVKCDDKESPKVEEMETWTKQELVDVCVNLGVEVKSKDTKQKLIEKITNI